MALAQLRHSKIWRGGVTSPYLNNETCEIGVKTYRSSNVSPAELEVQFAIASKGGGYTDIRVRIGADDFAAILKKMSEVDRQAAMTAMVAELQGRIAEQPHISKETKELVFKQLVDRANDDWRHKPSGDDLREQVMKDDLPALIERVQSDSE